MIGRHLADRLIARLRRHPAVALLGPRQVGKSTLARGQIAPAIESRAVDCIDLENPADLARLDDPPACLQSRRDRLVILDEVQRVPGLFQVLRGILDERDFGIACPPTPLQS